MSDVPAQPAPIAGTKAPPPPSQPRITVEQFCTTLSSTDKQVELIGAFHHAERVAGRHTDTTDNYQSRYAAFASQPA
jgi:hypothetical protein